MTLARELAEILEKYEALARLRQAREAYEAQGIYALQGEAAASRRREKQALARRFPGALRELEHLSAASLRRRCRLVQGELEGALGAPRRQRPRRLWLRAVLEYHAAWRESLWVRHWCREHAGLPGDMLVEQLRACYQHSAVRRRADRELTTAWLEQLTNPPAGRVSVLVWQDVARRVRRTPSTVQQWVFGRDVD